MALKYFFVCGHPRSGTNWVSALLNLHPKVLSKGEFHFDMLRRAMDDFLNPWWHAAAAEPMKSKAERGFQDLVRSTLSGMSELKPRAEWLGDQTPRQLVPVLPGSPHFVIVRDVRDVLVSLTYHWLLYQGPFYEPGRGALSWHRAKFAQDDSYFKRRPEELLSSEPWVRSACAHWASRIRHDRDAIKRMHRGELDGRALWISYEKLHEHVEEERALMYSFLGLDPKEAAPVSEGSLTQPGGGRKEEDVRSHLRSGKIGGWRKHVTPEQAGWIKQEAGEVLVELGYERNTQW